MHCHRNPKVALPSIRKNGSFLRGGGPRKCGDCLERHDRPDLVHEPQRDVCKFKDFF